MQAQNTLVVSGLSGNIGKGIFTFQIATQVQIVSCVKNRVNLGTVGNMEVTGWIFQGIWVFHVMSYLSVVLLVCIPFLLKFSITHIISDMRSSSYYDYTSFFSSFFPCLISLYGRYLQNKDTIGHTALGKQLLSGLASQSQEFFSK